ncbi:MAG: septum formation initiator family protein [Parafilimonas sp.]
MKLATDLFKIFSNKYLVSLFAFAILMLFSNHNDLFIQADRNKQLHQLLESKKFYENAIAKTKEQLSNLQNNPTAIEKYAREKFYMKRDNEDLFIVQNEGEDYKK